MNYSLTKKNKITIVSILLLMAMFFAASFFVSRENKVSLKSRAATAGQVDLEFAGQNTVAVAPDTQYVLQIKATSPDLIAIGKISFEYPSNIFKDEAVINYQTPYQGSALGNGGVDATTHRVTIWADGTRNTDGSLKTQSALMATVTFKVKDSVANGTSGTFTFKTYDILSDSGNLALAAHPTFSITAGSGAAATLTPTLTPTTGAAAPTATRTPTPTSTPIPGQTTNTPIPGTPTPTVDPNTASDVRLNLKLKFQGIASQSKPEFNNLVVKVASFGPGFGGEEQSINFVSGSDGTWKGSLNVKKIYRDLVNVYFLIKGPKHLQKKICTSNPTETYPGSYRCDRTNILGNVLINDGVTDLDFSGITLLVGDLPEQDGFVNSYDLSLVRNNLGSTDPAKLRLADLNLDGVIDTQDHSLIISALSYRTDEE